MIVLDTHAVIWLSTNDPLLGVSSREQALAALSEDELAISAITFWEIALLISKQRFEFSEPPEVMRRDLLETGIKEIALTGEIALLAVALNNLHADPADRFIAATAQIHGAALMTADQKLLQWKSPLVRIDASR